VNNRPGAAAGGVLFPGGWRRRCGRLLRQEEAYAAENRAFAGVLATALAVAGSTRAAEDSHRPAAEPVLRVYNIEELLLVPPDFPGPMPDVEYPSSGTLPVFSPAPPASYRTRGHRGGDQAPHRAGQLAGGQRLVEPRNGQLVVVQSPEVHRQIEDLLKSIREDARRRLLIRGSSCRDTKTAAEFRTRKDRSPRCPGRGGIDRGRREARALWLRSSGLPQRQRNPRLSGRWWNLRVPATR